MERDDSNTKPTTPVNREASSDWTVNERFSHYTKKKSKATDLRHPEQVLARPMGLMRQFQLESEQFRALLRVEENPEGKTTRH